MINQTGIYLSTQLLFNERILKVSTTRARHHQGPVCVWSKAANHQIIVCFGQQASNKNTKINAPNFNLSKRKAAKNAQHAKMSLKNYIFTTINTKATSHSLRHGPIDDRPPAAQRSFRRSATGLPDEVNVLDTHMDWIKQAWKFISIEPVMICWLLPSCLLYIAIENLALEKVFYISDDQFNFLNIIIFSQSRIYSHVA